MAKFSFISPRKKLNLAQTPSNTYRHIRRLGLRAGLLARGGQAVCAMTHHSLIASMQFGTKAVGKRHGFGAWREVVRGFYNIEPLPAGQSNRGGELQLAA